MIGQINLLKRIDSLIERNNLSQFLIISGLKGSGKQLIAKYIAEKLGALFILGGIKVEEIRDLLTAAYNQTDKIVYYFDNSDDMSAASKNSLLKTTEEPPLNAYFIIATEDLDNVLSTLKSRGMILSIEPYTVTDIQNYIKLKNYNVIDKSLNIISEICQTPGEVDLLISYDVIKFYNFCNLVVDNIGSVTGVNAFKIANQMKFKEDKPGWDISLFLKMIQYIIFEKCLEGKFNKLLSYDLLNAITAAKYRLRKNSINKSMLFDEWILKTREIFKCNCMN